jgi:hypothetical protein
MDRRRQLTIIMLAAIAAGGPLRGIQPVSAAPNVARQQRQRRPDSHGAAWQWLQTKAGQVLPGSSTSPESPSSFPAARQTPPAHSQSSMARLQWSFADVEASTVVERLKTYGFELPVEIEGRLTIALRVGVPWRSPFSSEEYDLDGELHAAQLTVAGIPVRNISARLTHDQGWLTLEHLKFQVAGPPGEKQMGSVSGSAEMQLTPPGDLTARLSFDRVPLAEARALLSDPSLQLSGDATGKAEARVAVERLHDRTQWRIRGDLAVREMKTAGLPPATFSAAIDVVDGVLKATKVRGEADHTRLDGAGQLNVLPPFNYSAELQFHTGKLSHLNRLHPEFKLPIQIRGSFGAAVRLTGSLTSNRMSLTGAVTAPEILLEGVKLEQLKFSFDADQDRLHVHPLNAGLYGGRIDLSLAMPLTKEGEIKAGLRWSRLPVDRLAREATGLDGTPAGSSSGVLQLRMPASRWHEPAAWQAHGSVGLQQDAASANGPQASATVQIVAGRLHVRDVVAGAGKSRLTGSAELQLATPFAYRLSLRAADVDLELFEKLAKNWRASARLSGRADVSTDLQGALSPLGASGQGSLAVRGLRAGPVEVESASCEFAANEQRIEIRKLDAALYGGHMQGSLVAGLSQKAASEATVKWQGLSLDKLCADLPKLPLGFTGRTNGSVHAAAPPGGLLDLAAWRTDAKVALRELALEGSTPLRVDVEVKTAEGVLDVARLTASQTPNGAGKEATLQASGRMKLTAPFAFRAAMRVADFDLSVLNGLPEQLRPPIDVQGRLATTYEVEGAVAPFSVAAQGAASLADLQLNAAAIDSLEFDFVVDEKALSLDSIAASLDEGQAHGKVSIPLSKNAAGEILLTLEQLDLAHLLAGLVRLPLRLQGRVDAKVDAQIPAGQLLTVEEWLVEASLDAAEIQADSVPLGHVHAALTSQHEVLKYQVVGETLGGQVMLSGHWHEPNPKHPNGVNEGKLRLEKLQLHRVGELLRRHGKLDSLFGTASVQFDYKHNKQSGQPGGAGHVQLDDLRWNDERLADRVRGSIRLVDDRLEIDEMTGELADGELLVHGVTSLGRDQRSALDIELYGADLRKLLFAWPSLAAKSKGMADLELRLYHGRGLPWQVHGDLQLHQAEIGDFLVRNLRTPLEISFDPYAWRRELRLHGLVMEVSPGRIAGDIHVVATSQLQLDVKGQISSVHLQKLFRHSPSSPKGSGTVTGVFQVSGRNVRSYHDLNGRLQATLRDAQGLPAMHQARSYTGGGLSSATRFDDGEVRATLSRGVVRFERLSLSGPKTQVYATGKASLGGKLDMDVTVNTNTLNPAAQGAISLATQLSLLVAPPVGLLLEANQFLANQVVHLQVRGTSRSPSIQVRPLPLLGEEAVRFFLMQTPE